MSLIGSPWFWGATTQGPKGQASFDGHHDVFAAHHLFNTFMHVTNYAHVATGEKTLQCYRRRRHTTLMGKPCHVASIKIGARPLNLGGGVGVGVGEGDS